MLMASLNTLSRYVLTLCEAAKASARLESVADLKSLIAQPRPGARLKFLR